MPSEIKAARIPELSYTKLDASSLITHVQSLNVLLPFLTLIATLNICSKEIIPHREENTTTEIVLQFFVIRNRE